MADRLWFVTGASRGIGSAIVEGALRSGDRVIAATRDPAALDASVREHDGCLYVERMDVARPDEVERTVARVIADVGVPDIVVNNAGYAAVGAIEELTAEALEQQMSVNFFGAVQVSRAFIEPMRKRGSGHIVQISTVGAVGHLPFFGAYNAGKWALEGLSAAMHDELQPFGIRVHLLQLGEFATDWAGSSMQFAHRNEAYDGLRESLFGAPGYWNGGVGEPSGDPPHVAAVALLQLLEHPDPPLRTIVGTGAHDMVRMALEARRDDYARDQRFEWPENTRPK